MTLPVIGVLGLQGDVVEHLQSVDAAGGRGVIVRRASELKNLDGLIIPGGESTVMSHLLVNFGLADPLREIIGQGLPVWGTCAGMILLATTVFDGRDDQIALGTLNIAVRRNAFGSQVNSYEESLTVTGLTDPYPAVFIRAPAVESVGAGVDILATSTRPTADGREAIVAVAGKTALATSFHPEISGDHAMHDFFIHDFVHGRQ